jgi:hypothetical protein
MSMQVSSVIYDPVNNNRETESTHYLPSGVSFFVRMAFTPDSDEREKWHVVISADHKSYHIAMRGFDLTALREKCNVIICSAEDLDEFAANMNLIFQFLCNMQKSKLTIHRVLKRPMTRL